MEVTGARLALARKALGTLEELACGPRRTRVERDAAIQRFEHTFEVAWKAVQRYLRVVEGLEAASPKRVVRYSLQAGLLDEAEARLAMGMVDDRNLTAHTYNEAPAEAIYGRLADYAHLLRRWLGAVEDRIRALPEAPPPPAAAIDKDRPQAQPGRPDPTG